MRIRRRPDDRRVSVTAVRLITRHPVSRRISVAFMVWTTEADESVRTVAKDGAPRTRRAATGLWIGVILAVASLVNYLAWLGWDRERDVAPDGSLSGPYEPWQVQVWCSAWESSLVVAGGAVTRTRHAQHRGRDMAVLVDRRRHLGRQRPLGRRARRPLPAVFLGVGLVAFLAASRNRA